MDTIYECTKGWSNRCANAKRKKCRCACGGRNHAHGKFQVAKQPRLMPETEFSNDEKFNVVMGHDILLTRTATGATANIEHRLVVHSPDGFEWGYGGSGPADLALNILAVFLPDRWALNLHQEFKWDFIAKMPHDGGTITAETIREWIQKHTPKQ